MQKITPFLWLEKDAGAAAKYYTSIFKDSKIKEKSTFDDTPSGGIEIVTMELFGQEFTLMAAGPLFKFNEAVSFLVHCDGQEEVDYYWEKLTADGGSESQCGWLKDKYGLSWQIIPSELDKLMSDPDPIKSKRVMEAMLAMSKIDISKLQEAYNK